MFCLVEKLPDFADDKKEENEEEEKVNSDIEEVGEEPAGHDRQDSNQADECKSKPMTTEQEDEKPNKKNEDKGTEFDGLQVSCCQAHQFNSQRYIRDTNNGHVYSKSGPWKVWISDVFRFWASNIQMIMFWAHFDSWCHAKKGQVKQTPTLPFVYIRNRNVRQRDWHVDLLTYLDKLVHLQVTINCQFRCTKVRLRRHSRPLF